MVLDLDTDPDYRSPFLIWRGAPRKDDTYAYGWAGRQDFNRCYWFAFFCKTSNTLWRDGKVTYDPKRYIWHSETDDTVSYPYAVTDDYGELRPVPHPLDELADRLSLRGLT